MSKKHLDNKLRNLILIALAVIIIIAVIIALRPKKVAINSLDGFSIPGAQAQSYAANQQLLLKNDDKIIGSTKAPLKIFVYEDYTNYYSAVLADTLDKIKADNGDKVAIIVRPYALKNARPALQAAVAVDCAGDQGKWLEMRSLLCASAKNHQAVASDFSGYARQIGLNADRFTACLTNVQKSEKIEQSVKEAASYQVLGVPTMFVGDEIILGARPYDDFIDSNGDKIEGLKAMIAKKLSEIKS